jgi:peptidoglycan/LPS O-acetylase OafA/YrhL
MHSFRAQHLPALDGLRGLAILLVITHHQLVPLSLKGGFLGVDLFFVLSGFLITRLLLQEFEATQSISLTKFYARRVLRLAPALLLYLIASLVVTYRIHPEEFGRQIKLVGLALAYLTNWRMALGWDYWLDSTAIIWSLSIEEQFYLLWPPLLLLALSARIRRRHIIIALTLIVLGVALHRGALWAQGTDLNRMYYGTDTRADAPLMGCLMALLSVRQLNSRTKAILNLGALASVGCLVWLTVSSTFTDSFLYREGYTIVAVAAGVLTWSVADSPESIIAQTLSWYPLRWFGFVSYGLYLWHWLLLRNASFYAMVGEWDTWAKFACAVLVAAASYYLIERQFTKLKIRFSYAGATPTREPIVTLKASPTPNLIPMSDQ